MARREWAKRVVSDADGRKELQYLEWNELCAYLLTKEHARAVRIVKRAKALQFHGLRDTDTNEFLEGYEAACVDILAALSNGRA